MHDRVVKYCFFQSRIYFICGSNNNNNNNNLASGSSEKEMSAFVNMPQLIRFWLKATFSSRFSR